MRATCKNSLSSIGELSSFLRLGSYLFPISNHKSDEYSLILGILISNARNIEGRAV